jgi:MIF4G domain
VANHSAEADIEAEQIPVTLQNGHSNETATAFRAILDNLKRKNVSGSAAKAARLTIENSSKAKACIDLVFEKAISKPVSWFVFAKFCRKICVRNGMFKRMLVVGCREYVKRTDRDNAEMVNIVRFIQHLIGTLLEIDILLDCVATLLRCADKSALSILCDLLGKHGMRLKSMVSPGFFDNVFAEMNAIGADVQVTQRVRARIQRLETTLLNDGELDALIDWDSN